FGMHGTGELAMAWLVPWHREAATERFQPALDTRSDAAGDHQADATAGAFGEIGRQLVVIAGLVLQSGMHRSHQDAVGQRDMAQIERGKQMGVIHAIHGWLKRSYECAGVSPPKASSARMRSSSSGRQLPYQCDVATHGFLFGDAVQLHPGFVLRGADEVEEAGLGTLEITLGTLLVECVQFQQGVVVRTFGQSLDVLGCLVELATKIVHQLDGPSLAGREDRLDSTRCRCGQRARLPLFPRRQDVPMTHAAPVPVLTIDGPSGSGKGTISALVAERLGWRLL